MDVAWLMREELQSRPELLKLAECEMVALT
jgi:hypothetical protein